MRSIVSLRPRIVSVFVSLLGIGFSLVGPLGSNRHSWIPGALIARADDPDSHWIGDFQNGANDHVMASIVYQGYLVAGGWFTQIGGVSAGHIARWDGTTWTPLGQGMDGGVYCLGIYQGDLIAAGYFSHADGQSANNIARWDGTEWQPLGLGTDSLIWSLTVWNNEVVVGGSFTHAGGAGANYIASWDGANWKPLGSGMVGEPHLAVGVFGMGSFGTELVAGGGFISAGGVYAHNIASWDGTTWHAIGSGTNGLVYAVGSFRDSLYIGGGFDVAGPGPAQRIARFDGVDWRPVGSGMSGGDYAVDALVEYNNRLIAGGVFTVAGGLPASRIAAWDGVTWQPLGSGLDDAVRNLLVLNSSLYVGGDFLTAGGKPSVRVGRWVDQAPSGVQGDGVPVSGVELASPCPSPFRSMTRFSFAVPADGPVRFTVEDVLGRRVASLLDETLTSGRYVLTWSGLGTDGRPVTAGMYFGRLETSRGDRTIKLLKMP